MERSKRERILDAALDMFVNNGFESSPTSKIAKQAGIATGTLFHYFKTKNDLINELYLDIKMGMVKALKQNLDQAKTIRQKLECIWMNAIKWAIEQPAGNKFFAMYGTSSYITTSTREEGYKQFSFVIAILTRGIEEEILKDISLQLMTETTFGLLSGTIHYFQEHKIEFEDEKIKKQAFAIYWDAIKR
jgi:AcrR family transcriptional regulator